MTRAVFLDRDNTIIHNDGDLGNPDEVRLIQGAATAIASLCGLGYKVVVITNQGGVARGKYAEDDVMLVHERIAQMVQQAANGARIDRFYYCPYHPDGTVDEYRMEHPWRKPQPGMLLQAAEDLDIDLPQSWMIGDQMRDVQAGAAAGTRTILLRPDMREGQAMDDLIAEPPRKSSGWRKDEPPPPKPVKPDYVVRSLVEAVRIMAQARKPDPEEARTHVVGKKWDAAAVRKLQESISTRNQPPAAAAPPEPPAADSSEVVPPRPVRSKHTSGRPFRPWASQAAEDDEPLVNKLRRQRRGETEGEPERPASPAPGAPAAPGPPPRGQPPAEAHEEEPDVEPEFEVEPEPEPVSPEEDYAAAAEARVIERRPAPLAPPASPPLAPEAEAEGSAVESVAPPSARGGFVAGREPSPPWHSIDQTLRLMLQELRSQRGTQGEFSYLYVVAIVLQMGAALCLVGGLWMGAADNDLFQRWIAAGLLTQLATIATLLFAK